MTVVATSSSNIIVVEKMENWKEQGLELLEINM